MNWKKSLLLILFMTWIIPAISAQSKKNLTEDSTISSTGTENTWTDEQVQALVDDLKVEKNTAIDKAVATAVIPLEGDIAALEEKNSDLDEKVGLLEDIIRDYDTENMWKCVAVGVGCSVVAFAIGYTICSLFQPQPITSAMLSGYQPAGGISLGGIFQ